MINVIIADDVQILRAGLKAVLAQDDSIKVVGEANNGKEAFELATRLKPDVVLMDMRMPDYDGGYGTRQIKEKLSGIKVLVLTTFDDKETVEKAVSSGADGYILKDLNQDGEDELVILAKGSLASDRFENFGDMVYAVYAMQNGRPVRVLESWSRNRNYLCADGGIYNEGSDGAAYSTWCIYDIKDGKAVIREGVQTTDKALENRNIKMAYLRMTQSHKLYDGEEISEAQADDDIARYQSMLLTDDGGFVSFAEYEKTGNKTRP